LYIVTKLIYLRHNYNSSKNLNIMKKILFVFSIFFINFLSAQTADEIIDKYLKNIGGKEKLSQIKTLKIQAKAMQQGMEIPIEIIMTADGKQYISAEIQGKKIVQLAFDGETAWHTNFMNMEPEKSDSETAQNLKKNLKGEFPIPFLNYKDKGYKVEFIGKEEVEGAETYKIKLTEHPVTMDGKEVPKEVYYYFDTENYVPIVAEEEIKKGQFKGAKVQQVFSDFQEVDGIYFPFSTAQKFNGMTGSEVKVVKIEINPQIDENIFKFVPASKTTESKTDEKTGDTKK